MKAEFVYLAVILDAFSRKEVGWALDQKLASWLTIAALERAIASYAHGEYVGILEMHGIVPSMSRPANHYDNARYESFMKTLKREEIYANRYDHLGHLRANIEEVHRGVLQPTAVALSARLSIS